MLETAVAYETLITLYNDLCYRFAKYDNLSRVLASKILGHAILRAPKM